MNMLVSTAAIGAATAVVADAADPALAAVAAAKIAVKEATRAYYRSADLEKLLPKEAMSWFSTVWDPEPPEGCPDDPRWIAAQRGIMQACENKSIALSALYQTKPTTLAGLAAMLEFVGGPEYPEEKVTTMTPCVMVGSIDTNDAEESETALAFLAHLAAAVREMAARV